MIDVVSENVDLQGSMEASDTISVNGQGSIFIYGELKATKLVVIGGEHVKNDGDFRVDPLLGAGVETETQIVSFRESVKPHLGSIREKRSDILITGNKFSLVAAEGPLENIGSGISLQAGRSVAVNIDCHGTISAGQSESLRLETIGVGGFSKEFFANTGDTVLRGELVLQ